MAKKVKPTQTEILTRLAIPTKKLVSRTVMRYANGHLASIFNESEMSALAQDTALEVARRVAIWNQNSRAKNSVNPKGAEAYFSRAFINQCQKLYEKHAKTDIRAGIQTVSSDEALAVAASKNLENPENEFIVRKELEALLQKLAKIDSRFNQELRTKTQAVGREPAAHELQHSCKILTQTLAGFEAHEIRDQLGLSEVDYARHRRAALELAKECMETPLADLIPHLENKLDYRLLTKTVKKRKKPKNRIRQYSIKPNFYIHSSFDNHAQSCATSLFVRLDPYEGEDPTRELEAELIKVETLHGHKDDYVKARAELLQKTKCPEFLLKIKELGDQYLQNPRKKVA